MASLNINSLRNKFQPVKEILLNGHVDVLSICESKLDDSFPNAQFSVKGYHCFRQDVSATSGGIITWTRNDIPCARRTDIEINDANIQTLILEMMIRKEKWFIISLYRLPNASVQSFCERLSEMMEKISRNSKMTICIGDINIDMLKKNTNSSALQDVLATYGMKNVVKEPTCFKATPSLIDVICASNVKRVGKVINFDCGLSDYHNLIATCSKIDVPKPKHALISYRSYKRFNDEKFKHDVNEIPTSILDIFDDVSEKQWAYNELLMSVVNEHAPMKQRYVVKQCAHMNKKLRKAIYKKRVARNRYLKNKGNPNLWEEYRRARNDYVRENRISMQNYFKKECNGGAQNKRFWDAIKPYFTDKSNEKSSIILREDENVLTDSQSVAKVFNDYFRDITRLPGVGDGISGVSLNDITKKYENHESIRTITRNGASLNGFRFTHVSVDDVARMLSKVDKKKSTGYDGLPAKLVCKVSDAMAPMVTQLINLMIDQCRFPEDMKYAEISPVFKKDDILDKTKYRPVSVLTCISKVFEKIINQQFSDHFYANYARNLSAYRKNHNTQSVLLRAVDDWKRALDEGSTAGALLMDLSKAFDVIPHGLLLAKLTAYGYNRDVVELIRSYITERKQRVKVNDARSEWTLTTMGVPQGSVLGPTLFNVFLNDMFLAMTDANIYNYADDNTLSVVSNSRNDLVMSIEQQGSSMTRWFENNQMKANPDKYQTIIFGKRKANYETFKISGAQIVSTAQVKLLGIRIDENLSFREHASSVFKKAAKQVNAMMRLSKVLDRDTKRHVYHSFIYSNFTYCPAVWLICEKTCMNQLEKVNCRALRFLYDDFDSTYNELLAKGNHKSMSVLLMHSIATEVYKSLNGLSPDYMVNMFTRNNHDYNMRNRQGLIQPSFSTIKYGYSTFSYLGAKIWNRLPNDVKESSSLSVFKNRLSLYQDCSSLLRFV